MPQMRSGKKAFVATVVSMAAAGALFGACQEPTQVRLQLWTDIPCKEFGGVAITSEPSFDRAVQSVSTGTRIVRTSTCGANGYIGDLFVYPENGTSEAAIVVRAGRAGVDPSLCKPPNYAGCVVAKRQVAFLPNRTLDLAVWLYGDCIDVPCTDAPSASPLGRATTCIPGKKCVDVLTSCVGAELACSIPNLPAGDVGDAGQAKDAAKVDAGKFPPPCENVKAPAICGTLPCADGEHCCATKTAAFCTREACETDGMRACCTDPNTCTIGTTCIRATGPDGLAQTCVQKPVPIGSTRACRGNGDCTSVSASPGCKQDYGNGTIGFCIAPAATTAVLPQPPPPPRTTPLIERRER
ncbi:MAG: hypothetical protein U0174_05955 [Polyangiaceae bacterium]